MKMTEIEPSANRYNNFRLSWLSCKVASCYKVEIDKCLCSCTKLSRQPSGWKLWKNYKQHVSSKWATSLPKGHKIMHFLHSRMNNFATNFGDVSGECGERFLQDISLVGRIYQGHCQFCRFCKFNMIEQWFSTVFPSRTTFEIKKFFANHLINWAVICSYTALITFCSFFACQAF